MMTLKGKPREVGLPMPWKEQGLCWDTAGVAGDWLEVPNMPIKRQREAKAVELAICRHCPVRPDCLEYALAINQPSGIWGGMVPKDRARLRKERR